MLTTGVRTPVGLKISGADLKAIEEIGAQIEALLPQVPGTRSVFAERTGGGYFLDFEWNREALARYGLSIDEAQAAVRNAIGGENVTTTIEGRERYPVNVRYLRDFRSDFGALGRVLVAASGRPAADPAGPARHHQGGHRAVHDPGRGRPAHRLRLRGSGGARPGQLRRGGRSAAAGEGEAPAGLRHRLERPVRGHAAGQAAAEGGRSADAAPHLPAALHEHPVGDEDLHHRAGRALLRRRRHLVPVPARLQHEHRRVGGPDRPAGRGRRDRRLHAPLPGPGLRAGEAGGTAAQPGRAAGRPSSTARSSASGPSS